jgi:hypothetical protein
VTRVIGLKILKIGFNTKCYGCEIWDAILKNNDYTKQAQIRY